MRSSQVMAGAAALALAFAPAATFAETASGAMPRPHNASCSIVSSPFLLTYDPLAQAPIERTASVTVRCQALGPMHLTVEADGGSSGSPIERTMSSTFGGGKITYTLLLDGQPFGDGSGGTRRFERDYATTSGTVTATFLVTLVAPAGQDAPVGSYADRVGLLARF